MRIQYCSVSINELVSDLPDGWGVWGKVGRSGDMDVKLYFLVRVFERGVVA